MFTYVYVSELENSCQIVRDIYAKLDGNKINPTSSEQDKNSSDSTMNIIESVTQSDTLIYLDISGKSTTDHIMTLNISENKNHTLENNHVRKKRDINLKLKRAISNEYNKYVNKVEAESDCQKYFKDFSESLNKEINKMKVITKEMLTIRDEMVKEGLNNCQRGMQEQNRKTKNLFATTSENNYDLQLNKDVLTETPIRHQIFPPSDKILPTTQISKQNITVNNLVNISNQILSTTEIPKDNNVTISNSVKDNSGQVFLTTEFPEEKTTINTTETEILHNKIFNTTSFHSLIKSTELNYNSTLKSESRTSLKKLSHHTGVEKLNKTNFETEVGTEFKQNEKDVLNVVDLYNNQNINKLLMGSFSNLNSNNGEISSAQNNYPIFDPNNIQPKVVLTQQIPPTGPDGSNYGKFYESLSTSQQLTLAHNRMWKPVCYRAPKQSGIVCLPVFAHQNNYRTYNSEQFDDLDHDETCLGNDKLCKKEKSTGINQSSTSNTANGEMVVPQQPIIIAPTNPPAIHVPTAISSPNPYYFPTVGGNPVFTPFSSPGVGPSYYATPQMAPLFFQQSPQAVIQPQQQPYVLPQQYFLPQQQNFQLNQPQVYQPNYQDIIKPQSNYFPQPQMVLPQQSVVQQSPSLSNSPNFYFPTQTATMYNPPNPSPQIQQEPFYCTYVPTQTYKFPVVNGVMEVRESETNVTKKSELEHNTVHQNKTDNLGRMNSGKL